MLVGVDVRLPHLRHSKQREIVNIWHRIQTNWRKKFENFPVAAFLLKVKNHTIFTVIWLPIFNTIHD